MVEEQQVKKALALVIDPELGINIVDLGLIYGVDIDDEEKVQVMMSLTTPGCPLGGYFIEQVTATVAEQCGVDEDKVGVEIVWDPPWTQDMMTEEARAELGFD